MSTKQETRAVPLAVLCLLALIVGIVTGYGAVFFRAIIALVHNLFFLGHFSFIYEANEFTPPSPWGPLVILVPVIGGMGVIFLVRNFAPEAKGHGVPEVMDSIYYKGGAIRPVVAVVKSLASALSIGTGAAVGREGPIIQIGASFSSTLGGLLKVLPSQRITLVAAGAGAGIAATFNTPLGAVMFAVELMMPEVSTRTFLPVVIATGAATYIGRLYFGFDPAFSLPAISHPEYQTLNLPSMISFILLGIVCGLACWAFVRLLVFMEDFFEGLPWSPYIVHALGMTIVGISMYLLMVYFGHYYVEGVGYSTIQAILFGNMTAFFLLALLFVVKIFATTISLGSGASGGVFSPSLFLGATLGGAFGALMLKIGMAGPFGVVEFAMVGMAAIAGGATGAAMTAIFMIFEMTRDYNIIVPMIVTVALSIGIRRILSPENIYTIKLARRGRRIPKDRHSNMFLVRQAGEVMEKNILIMPASASLAEGLAKLRAIPAEERPGYLVLTEGKHIAGIVHVDAALLNLEEVKSSASISEVADHDFILSRENQAMFDILKRLSRHQVEHVLVTEEGAIPRPDRVRGVISKQHIANSVIDGVSPFAG